MLRRRVCLHAPAPPPSIQGASRFLLLHPRCLKRPRPAHRLHWAWGRGCSLLARRVLHHAAGLGFGSSAGRLAWNQLVRKGESQALGIGGWKTGSSPAGAVCRHQSKQRQTQASPVARAGSGLIPVEVRHGTLAIALAGGGLDERKPEWQYGRRQRGREGEI